MSDRSRVQWKVCGSGLGQKSIERGEDVALKLRSVLNRNLPAPWFYYTPQYINLHNELVRSDNPSTQLELSSISVAFANVVQRWKDAVRLQNVHPLHRQFELIRRVSSANGPMVVTLVPRRLTFVQIVPVYDTLGPEKPPDMSHEMSGLAVGWAWDPGKYQMVFHARPA